MKQQLDRIVAITVLCPGHVDFKRAPVSRGTFYRDTAAVRLGNVFYNGEAKTCAAHLPASCLVYSIKPLKDPGQMFFVYAATVVSHADDDFGVNLSGLDLDCTALIAVFDGVVKEINDGLLKECWIYLGYQGFAGGKLNLDSLGNCHGLTHLDG